MKDLCQKQKKSLDRFDNLYIDIKLEMLTGLLNDCDCCYCCIILMTIKLIMKKTLSQKPETVVSFFEVFVSLFVTCSDLFTDCCIKFLCFSRNVQ